MKLPTRRELEERLKKERKEGVLKLETRIYETVEQNYRLLVDSGTIEMDVSHVDREILSVTMDRVCVNNPDYDLHLADDPYTLIIAFK